MIDPELALSMIRTSKVIAFDTETDGLVAGRNKVVGYVVTDFDNSVYVPCYHEPGGNIVRPEEFEDALNEAFAERTRLGYRTVGHHLGFDLRMAAWAGVTIGGVLEDTMINESLIDDRTRGYSLDECSRRHGVTVKLGDELYRAIAERFGGIPDRKQMQHFWRMPGDHPAVVDYATGDGVSTLELWQSQQPILDAEELRKPWKLECDLLPYLARMHRTGLKIDPYLSEKVDGQARIYADVEKRLAEAKAELPKGLNVRSPKEVEELYRANGFGDSDFARTDPTPRNPKGSISFTEKWLETNDIGTKILGVRRIEKARDSFIAPLVDTYNIRGRVHPVLHQSKSDDYGVAGARLSCSDPNLQAFPKRNKVVGKSVRPLIVADEGMVFEEADFKQQEPRLFTHYSEEPALIKGYNDGSMDIHDRASEVLAMPRDYAKRLGLGMLTMMTPPTLAGHMRCSLADARTMHRAFLTDAFPMIGKFQQDVILVFKQRGYVKSILGRKARLESSRFAYQGVSRVIQNSGGDHMKTALLRANQYQDAYPNEVNILLSIHDSTIWQRDPGHDNKELVRVIENVAHEPDFNLLVPIPVDVGTGLNWSEASYGK